MERGQLVVPQRRFITMTYDGSKKFLTLGERNGDVSEERAFL